MTSENRSWWIRLRDAGFTPQAVFLSLTAVAAYGVVGPIAGWLTGVAGLMAAGVAATACWMGAVFALVVGFPFRSAGPHHSWMGFLAGMLPRMGVPLAFAAVLRFHAKPLAEAGVIYYVLVFYLVLLGLETAISLPTRRFVPRRSDDSRSGLPDKP